MVIDEPVHRGSRVRPLVEGRRAQRPHANRTHGHNEQRGGEALANTDWEVMSPAGDVISESKGAFPRVILAEGEYKVIARNDNRTYQHDLKVITGVDGEIEVLAR